MEPIKTILVPVDFDDVSALTVATAVRFAKNLGARVTLLHVEPYKLADIQAVVFDAASPSGRATTDAIVELTKLADVHSVSGVPISIETRQGMISDEILGAVQNHAAEMIVMGTHGRKGLAHSLLGSVAEKVMRAASVPVMTVRAPARTRDSQT